MLTQWVHKIMLIETGSKRRKKLLICKSCEEYKPSIKICGVCKCFMPLKVNIPGNNCPKGKHKDL